MPTIKISAHQNQYLTIFRNRSTSNVIHKKHLCQDIPPLHHTEFWKYFFI